MPVCLAPDRALGSFARARVVLRLLPTNGQVLAVANAPIAAKVEQTLDIELVLTTKITFDRHRADMRAKLVEFFLGQFAHLDGRVDARRLANITSRLAADAEDVRQRDFRVLVIRNVDSC